MHDTLNDYREILAGLEDDLRASEALYNQLVADCGNAWERVIENRAAIRQMKNKIAEMQPVSA